ncbi:GlxA family transcriptional regulator [Pantoea sp. SGAir0183]
MSCKNIAVLAFHDISPFHLSVPCLVFENRTEHGLPAFNLRVCAAETASGDLIRTCAGFMLKSELTLEDATDADVLIVPSWRSPQERPSDAMLHAIRMARQRGATVVGLCMGAFVLAEAGVLDGYKATTHWSAAPYFAQHFPKIKLMPDVLYQDADDGRLVTSAGTAAGLDCCLHLVRRWHGADIANKIARRLVTAPHRQGGQAQYIEQPLHSQPGGDRLSDLLNWMVANLAEQHSLDSLAQRVAMSRRNFTRRFRDLTGMTVSQWLQGQRLAYAQRLLESTPHSVEYVAQLSGFGSAVSLRQYFNKAFNTSPSAWRALFAHRG